MNLLRPFITAFHMVRFGWHMAWVRYLQWATTAQMFGRGEAFTVDLDLLRHHQLSFQLARLDLEGALK